MGFVSSNNDFKYNSLSVNVNLEREYEAAPKKPPPKKSLPTEDEPELKYTPIFGLSIPCEYRQQLEPFLEQLMFCFTEFSPYSIDLALLKWKSLSNASIHELPPLVFIVCGLFRMTVRETMKRLESQSILEVLSDLIRTSKPRQQTDIQQREKSAFLTQCTSKCKLSNSKTLSKLYDFVEGDKGLFLLGTILILDFTIHKHMAKNIDESFLPEQNEPVQVYRDTRKKTTDFLKSNNKKRLSHAKSGSRPKETPRPTEDSVDFGDGVNRDRSNRPEPSKNFSELMKELDSDIDRVQKNQESMTSFRDYQYDPDSPMENGARHVDGTIKANRKNRKDGKKNANQRSKLFDRQNKNSKTTQSNSDPDDIRGTNKAEIVEPEQRNPEEDSDGGHNDRVGDGLNDQLDCGHNDQHGDEFDDDSSDEMENDPEFLSLVEHLSEVFPKIAKSELKVRLTSAKSVEELMEILILEEETYDIMERLENEHLTEEEKTNATKKYSADVYRLKDMFPNYDNDMLEKVLESHHGDMQLASFSLLNNEEPDFAKRTTDSVWTSRLERLADNVETLKSLVDLSNEEVMQYLHQNRRNIFDTLEDIVYNYKKQPDVPPLKDLIPAGGRVQGPKTTAVPLYAKALSNSIKTFDKESPEYQELASIYHSNPAMHVFKLEFLMKCLDFFGNVYRVVEASHYLIDNNILPDVKNKLVTKVIKPKITLPKIDLKVAFENYHKNLSDRKATLEAIDLKVIDDFLKTSVVDLHGYKYKDGLKIALKVLLLWWDEEIGRRIDVGEFSKYGSKAQFVNYATIITGRGIHSAGGVAILKKGVSELLNRGNFIYEEKVGRFEVLGKKLKS